MSFSLVLHAHIPYCRKSGTWPAGEEWLHEAIIESYLPMFRSIKDLQRESIPLKLNIEFTPILLEQLADPYMQDKFVGYLDDLIRRAREDQARFHDRPTSRAVAESYLEEFTYFRDVYVDRMHKDLIGAFKRLQDEGLIEIFTSAATHGFLPLMDNESAIFSQIQIGCDIYKKYFGKTPRGFWLPECAFRPMVYENDYKRPGLDYLLKRAGIKYIIVNYTGIDQSVIRGVNPDGVGYKTTFEGYSLAGTGVNVFGRNYATSEKVWSAEVGYPGNPHYREFHLKDPISGLRYHAVSEKNGPKQLYEIGKAKRQSRDDAKDFVAIVSESLSDYREINNRPGIVMAPYDFELFGHWWYEGPTWMKNVFAFLSEVEDVKPITLSEYIAEKGSQFSKITLPKTTWGEGGDFRVWKNPQHGWIWPLINDCVKNFEGILDRINEPRDEKQKRILLQMARELLLMEGSDWPFLLYTEQASKYANQRFHWHHQRFNTLLWAAKDFSDMSRLSISYLEELESIDNPFQDVNLNYFKHRNA